MTTIRLIYLVLMTLTFGVGLYAYNYHKALRLLILILGLGLFTECAVEINKGFQNGKWEDFIYNLYIPLEYLLYASFFFFINDSRSIRKAIIVSVPVYILFIFLLRKFSPVLATDLNTTIYTFGGLVTVVWSLWTLFIIKPTNNSKFIVHPLFWICTGLIIFFAGITPFNLMYGDLKGTDKELFNFVSFLFQKGLNLILYALFIIGFICSHRMKKL